MRVFDYGDFGQEEGGFWTDLTKFVTQAVVPTVQAIQAPKATVPKAPPPGMSYTASGQLVPKQAGLFGGISTNMLLGLAAVGAVVLVMTQKGRRRW